MIATLASVVVAQDDPSAAAAVVGLLILLLPALGLYLIPTLVAAARKVPNVGSVAVVNVFLGWSLVGWVVALALACRSNPPPAPVVNVGYPARDVPLPPPPGDSGGQQHDGASPGQSSR